jgi:hypothetical protein
MTFVKESLRYFSVKSIKCKEAILTEAILFSGCFQDCYKLQVTVTINTKKIRIPEISVEKITVPLKRADFYQLFYKLYLEIPV